MARRYRPRKKPFFKKPIFWKALLLAIFLFLSVYLFYFSPFFRISQVEVKPSEEAKEKLTAFLPLGKNFFFVFPSKIRQEILKIFPQFEEIEIKKIFPNKVIFKIKERKPWALLYFGDQVYLIDEQGFVFKDGDQNLPQGIIFKSFLKPILGEQIFKKEIFEETKNIIKFLFKNGIKIDEITFDNEKITFVCQGGLKIYFSNEKSIVWEGKAFYYFFDNYLKELSPKEYLDFRFSSPKNGRIYFK